MWLRGRGPLSSLAGLETSDAKASGMSRTELRRVSHKKPKFPANAWQLELLAHRVQVPNKETTYWCRVHKLPAVLKQKYTCMSIKSAYFNKFITFLYEFHVIIVTILSSFYSVFFYQFGINFFNIDLLSVIFLMNE